MAGKQLKIPICLLIGAGSRTEPLLRKVHKKLIPVEIVCVVSHKALLPDRSGQKTVDVFGIALAKKLGFRTEYFNLIQMRKAAEDVAKKTGKKFDGEKYREQFFFPVLAAFLKQSYPISPEAVFMNGWDLVLPPEFLDFFPGPKKGESNVINFHPSLLPDKSGKKEVALSDGTKIPILIGEESTVLNDALRLKLPAIGATMHRAQVIADDGGSVLDKVEIPIRPGDTFETLRARHIKAESNFMAGAIDRWARKSLGL